MKIKKLFSTTLFLTFLGGIGYGGYIFFQDRNGPTMELTPNTGAISQASELTLHLSDPSKVRSVEVFVRSGNQSIPVFSKHFDPYTENVSTTFSFKNAPIPEGDIELELKAKDASLAAFGLGNSTIQVFPVRLDNKPPRIGVKTLPPNVRRGGTGVIRYTVNEEVLSTGVQVGEQLFQGFRQPDNSYIAYFAFPHGMKMEDFTPEVLAKDLAGNTTKNSLRVNKQERKFKEDTIKITDAFLDRVSQKLLELAPDASTPLERFLIINSDIRFANTQFLRHLGPQTGNETLWEGSFMSLPRGASRAGYGEYRTYVYNGEPIDNQWHLGYDLASVKQAKIPAANAGKVIFVGDLGIYGNLVVIDHGLGLMSLYSHLTDILVNKDDAVKKGDFVGTTGTTGMAFGDHVHFGMLVGGIEVTPLEWLDPKWIRDNITGRLNAK